jgi:hypothetical protein
MKEVRMKHESMTFDNKCSECGKVDEFEIDIPVIDNSEADYYKNQVDILSEAVCKVLKLFDEDPSESKERDILNKALKDCKIGRWSEPCDPIKAIQEVINQEL